MKRLTQVGVVLFLLATFSARAVDWETNYEDAVAQAKKEGKYLLLDFSGSDWCGWCIRLEEEVFGKRAFRSFADDRLVCVLVDSPRTKALSRREKQQNDGLKAKYSISGYPTVILLHPDESTVGRTGYLKGGPEPYIKNLEKMIEAYEQQNPDKKPVPQALSGPTGLARTGLAAVRKRVDADENRPMREWSSRSGQTLTASLLEESWGSVVLKKQDDTKVKILISRLSAADQEYIRQVREGVPGVVAAP